MDLLNQYIVPFFSGYVIPIGLIVLGFGFLIFVHELGHFLVAKLVGIKTTQFAIGFGHSLITWRKGLGFRTGTTEPEYEKLLAEGADPKTLGETEYRLNYIPLGGYVKMLGQEDMDPTARSSDPRAFNNKSVSARLAVISAGVIMNLIFGMIFFVIAFMSGVKFPPAIVGDITPDSPAAMAYAQGHTGDEAYLGLQPDDRITHINGKEAGDMFDVKYATILTRGGASLELTVDRESEAQALTYLIKPQKGGKLQLQWIGIDAPVSLEVGKVKPDSEIDKAGVRKGMFITAVNGQPVDRYSTYEQSVTEALGHGVVVTFTDQKTGRTVEVGVAATPQLTRQDDSLPNLLGLVPPVMIASVDSKEPAAKAGIEPGDLIAAINGRAWPDLQTFQESVQAAPTEGVEVTVLRDGQELILDPIKPRKKRIGVGIRFATDSPIVGQTLADSPLQATDSLVGGSKLLELNGTPVDSFGDLQRVLARLLDGEGPIDVELTYELNLGDRPRETTTISVGPEAIEQLANAGWDAPLPDGMPLMTLQVPVVSDDPAEAVVLGFEKTHQFITQTYMTLVRLTQGSVSPKLMSGPIGIVHHGTKIAERGWQYLLFFLGLISINLAVINFLPIPITDGGLAVFLFVEKIKGSPVSARIQTAATVAGLAVLACVFLFVTYNDLLRLFNGI